MLQAGHVPIEPDHIKIQVYHFA